MESFSGVNAVDVQKRERAVGGGESIAVQSRHRNKRRVAEEKRGRRWTSLVRFGTRAGDGISGTGWEQSSSGVDSSWYERLARLACGGSESWPDQNTAV